MKFAKVILLGLSITILLLGPTSSAWSKFDVAKANQLFSTQGDQAKKWQEVARRSLVPLPAAKFILHLSPCPGFLKARGCAPSGNPPQVWINPKDMNAKVWLHEIGHHFDYLYLTDQDKEAFKKLWMDTRPWAPVVPWPKDFRPSEEVLGPPMEWFAMGYSLCARKQNIKTQSVDRYLYAPTPQQHRKVCSLIKKAYLKGPLKTSSAS